MKNYLFRDDRWTGFPKLINKFRYEIGIEIGVAFGHFSEHLLMFSDLEILYGLDNCPQWDAVKDLEQRFAPRYKFIDGYSPTYSENFPNEYFDFIYIDAGHTYKRCKWDINYWWWKLKPGGLICGDDYLPCYPPNNLHPYEGEFRVIDAVQEFCQQRGIYYYVTGCDSLDENVKLEYSQQVWDKLKIDISKGHTYIQIPQWWIIK